MPPQGSGRRLSSRFVTLGMLGSLSVSLVACSTGSTDASTDEKTTTAACVDAQPSSVPADTGMSASGDFGDTPAPTASGGNAGKHSAGSATPTAVAAADGGDKVIVADTYCEDEDADPSSYHHRYYWFYGGHSYYRAGRYFLAGGSSIMPHGSRIRTSSGHILGGGGTGAHSVNRGGFGSRRQGGS